MRTGACVIAIAAILCGPAWTEEGIWGAGSWRHIEVDLDALRLKTPLLGREESEKESQALITELSKRARGREEDLYDGDFIGKMVAFVCKYPGDESSLTMKLCLATYISMSRDRFRLCQGAEEINRRLGEEAVRILDSIHAECPETWQGRLAGLEPSAGLEAQMTNDKEMQILLLRRQLPVVLDLEKDPGFLRFHRMLGFEDPIEVDVRTQIVRLEMGLRDMEGVEQDLRVLKERFPESKATKRLVLEFERIKAAEAELSAQ